MGKKYQILEKSKNYFNKVPFLTNFKFDIQEVYIEHIKKFYYDNY